MDVIQMKDVRSRMYNLSAKGINEKSNYDVLRMMEKAKELKSESMVENVLHNWRSINANEGLALKESIDLFEEVSSFCNTSFMKNMCNIICEEAIPKARDGSETQAYIKHKLGRFKTKISTKINNNVEDMKNAAKSGIDNFEKNVSQVVDNVKGNSSSNDNNKEEVKKECYERMYNTLENCRIYDRILENHNKLSKRYNVDILIDEISFLEPNDIVYEICKLVDTYSMDLKYKYNIALENSLYALYKNSIHCENSIVVEAVTDYFLLNANTDEHIDIIKESLKNNRTLLENDIVLVDYIFKTEPTIHFSEGYMNNNFMNQSESEYLDSLSSVLEMSKINAVRKLINAFKLSKKEKTPKEVNALMRNMFSKSAENIIDETPNFFIWIKNSLVFGSYAIHPVVGLITTFTTFFIGMHVKRKEAERMIKVYKSDIEKSKKKLKTLKSANDKSRCEAYIKTLEESLEKLEIYRDDLYSEEEIDERDKEDFDKEDEKLESAEFELLNSIIVVESHVEYMTSRVDASIDTLLKDIGSNITSFNLNDLDAMSTIVKITQEPIRPIQLAEVFEESVIELRKMDTYDKYVFIDCLNENIYDLKKMVKDSDKKLIINEDYIKSEFIYELMKIVDLVKNENIKGLSEASMTNSLKMASIKLKKMAVNLTDKEKQASQSVDNAMRSLSNGIEKSLTINNRDAVIRGSILPSASKVIKAAVVTGGAALIHPAIAVIGAIGAIGVSKKFKSKERQLILDDIEIELKMTEKYIKIAEDKNDLVATKDLLVIQRNLERQRQRIKYKMEVEYKQHVPDVKPGADND